MNIQFDNSKQGGSEKEPVSPFSKFQPKIQAKIQPALKSKVQPAMNTANNDSATKLPEEVKGKMENSFGQDFSDINIHKDSASSDELNARAYTQGADIHFSPGEFQPNTRTGQELIGHELTHVLQQKQGRVSPTVQKKDKKINDDESLEKEADEMGGKAARGEAVNMSQYSISNNNNSSAQLKAHNVSCSCPECSGVQLKARPSQSSETIQTKSHSAVTCNCPECTGSVQLKSKNSSSDTIQKADKSPFDTKGEQTFWYGKTAGNKALHKDAENNYVEIYKGVVPKLGVAKLDPLQKYAATKELVAAGTTLYAVKTATPGVLKTVNGPEYFIKQAAFMAPIVINAYQRVAVTGVTEKKEKIQYDQIDVAGTKLYLDHSTLMSSKFDLTYATKVPAGLEEIPLSSRRGSDYGDKNYRVKCRNFYKEKVSSAYISGDDMKNISVPVPKINSANAFIYELDEKTKTYTATKAKFAANEFACVLEEALVVEPKGSNWYGLVRDDSGVEGWTYLGPESRKAAGLNVAHGNISFKPFSRFDELKDDKVSEMLMKQYHLVVDAKISKKDGLSKVQKDLLTEAKNFLGTGPDKTVTGTVTYKSEDVSLGEYSLSPDLISRLDLFYKFLLQKGLIFKGKTENLKASDGMREQARAHQLSTSYSINTKLGNGMNLENFTELTDGKDLDGNQWYKKDEDDSYDDVPLDEKELKAEQEKAKLANRKPVVTKKVFSKSKTLAKIKIRSNKIVKQTAEAAEGYKKGSEKAKPNIYPRTSNHCIGEAVDIHFPFKFNAYDPIIDAIAAYFGLARAVKESSGSGGPEDWHYERMGIVKNKGEHE